MRPLDRLLRPRSIAVMGGGWAGAVVGQLLKMGYSGAIWPVHPGKADVAGLPAYPGLDTLPGPPDAVFIGVNRHLTVEAVRTLRNMGAGGAICFASGFAESGEAGLNAALIEAAGEMPVLGPNCYGFLNYLDGVGLWPDQHGGAVLGADARGVAILTQSSNIALNLTMQRRGLPLAYLVTLGNQAQTGMADVARALLRDARVTALGLHMEGFGDLRALEALSAEARAAKKPVIALKVGRSAAARVAGLSHTASMSGDGAAAGAFLARLGFGEVESLPGFLEALKLAHAGDLTGGTAVTSLSCSGGEAGLIADAALGTQITFPAPEPQSVAALETALGPLVPVRNPMDYHTFIWNDLSAMTEVFSGFVRADVNRNLLILDFPRADRCDASAWAPTLEAFGAALRALQARGAVVASLPENLPEDWAERAWALGIAPLCGLPEALGGITACAAIGRAWAAPAPPPILGPRPAARARGLGEAEAKRRLAAAGLPVPPGMAAEAPDHVVATLGLPLALKAMGSAHKTEAGGVRLGIGSVAALADAMAEMASLGPLHAERMVEGGLAELLVGITDDPVLGPCLTLGAGGVLVEVMEDTRTLLLPTDADAVEAALRALRLAPLLAGHRDKPPVDMEALVGTVLGLARYVEAHPGIRELEVNPLIACADGAWIADAVMTEVDDG